MCSRESIKGRAAFNNLLCIISHPIVPSGMVGHWVRCSWASALASSLPGHLWGGSVPCLQEMQDKGWRARLSASWGHHSLLPLQRAWESREGVCHLSEAQGRSVLFSGMSSFYCCFFFSSGFKLQDWGGEWCSQTAVCPRIHVAGIGRAGYAGASKQEQPIHPSTPGTWLVKPHCRAFSYPSSTYTVPGWARGHSLRWSPNPCVLLTACTPFQN